MVPGKAIDLGAGEGSDIIRLAKLGFEATAVELTHNGAAKLTRYAAEQNVAVRVIVQDIVLHEMTELYDIVLCNGVLHYIEDKNALLSKIKLHTTVGGLNSISCFTDATPVPDCHSIVEVFPDKEDGIIAQSYRGWDNEYFCLERDIKERSHEGFEVHSHSFIKLIARKPTQG
jgi:tellurite methyltransferase